MNPISSKFIVSRDILFDKGSSYYGANGIPLKQEKPMYVELEVSSLSEQGEWGSFGSNQSDFNLPRPNDNNDGVAKNSRPKRNMVKPARYWDENFISSYSCFFANPSDMPRISRTPRFLNWIAQVTQ